MQHAASGGADGGRRRDALGLRTWEMVEVDQLRSGRREAGVCFRRVGYRRLEVVLDLPRALQ